MTGTRAGSLRPALLAVPLLASLCVLHVYWALGGRWPGTDDASFARRVLGDTTTLPPTWATWVVAMVLGCCAAVVAATVPGIARWVPRRPIQVALWCAAAGFALRALSGLTSIPPVSRGTGVPYYTLDLTIYSPLCLLISVLIALAARSRPVPQPAPSDVDRQHVPAESDQARRS